MNKIPGIKINRKHMNHKSGIAFVQSRRCQSENTSRECEKVFEYSRKGIWPGDGDLTGNKTKVGVADIEIPKL